MIERQHESLRLTLKWGEPNKNQKDEPGISERSPERKEEEKKQ